MKTVYRIFTEIIPSESNQNHICALHIRRGDYTSVQNSSIYPLLGSVYYQKGIKQFGTRIVKLVVFSDEKSIKFDFFQNYEILYISDYGLSDYEEFQLMSMFKNIIIANSTFSFWSAICNPSIEKVKIAPQSWSFVELENKLWQQNLQLESFLLV